MVPPEQWRVQRARHVEANEAAELPAFFLPVPTDIGFRGHYLDLRVDVQGTGHYVYRVMACNSAGCSAPSAEVSVTTPAYSVFIGEEQ